MSGPRGRRPGVAVGSRIPAVTLVYTLALLATNVWLETSSPGYERRMLQSMSTDVWHLVHDPWTVLPGSAFFTTGGLVYALGGALLCMGLLERQAGWRLTLLVAVSGHLLGTAISEGVVAIRVAVHDLPSSAWHNVDVGPSYLLVACAATVIMWRRAHPVSRLACALALIPVFVFTAWRIPSGEVDAIGHLSAAAVGAGWGWVLTRRGAAPGLLRL